MTRLRLSWDKNQIIDFFNMVGGNEVKLRKASRFVVRSKDMPKKTAIYGEIMVANKNTYFR